MTIGSSAVLEPLRGEPLSSEAAGSGMASFGIAPRREAAKQAREFTKTALQRWGLAEMFDDVALVASELVTNALRHALGVEGDSLPSGPAPVHVPCPVEISLVRQPARLVCAVRDPSSRGPISRHPDHAAEGGRGLYLVDCFSDRWGWQRLDGTGKIVWAVFSLPTRGSGPDR